MAKLDELERRLIGVDITFWPIHERVLRSRVRLGHLHEEMSKGPDWRVDYWYTGIELVEALWWEIRAIGFLRRWPKGKQSKDKTTESALLDLLDDKPNANTKDALVHLNVERPGHGLRRKSITVALSKARKKHAKKLSG